MEEGADAGILKGLGLTGMAAGDQRRGWPDLVDGGELSRAHLFRREAENTHAPRALAQRGLGRPQHGPGLFLGGEGQSDERERAMFADGGGESGLITDPGHRSLRHR